MESPRLKTPILTLISYLYAHRERFWSRGAKFGLFFWQKTPKRGGVPISPPEKLERSVRGQNRVFLAPRIHFLGFKIPLTLGPKIPKLVYFSLEMRAPVISETKRVGIFCLFTKLFTYDSRTTLNSSLRSKNFWISIFFCMRHRCGQIKHHKIF